MARLLSRRFLIVIAVILLAAGGVLVGLDLSGVFSDDQVQTTDQPIPAPIPGNGPTGPMHRLWSVQANGVAPDGGQVLVSTTDHGLAALDVHTGAVRWSYRRTDDKALWGLTIIDSVVVAEFLGGQGVTVVGLDEAHGTKLWSDDGLSLGSDDVFPGRLDVPVAAGNTVYALEFTSAGATLVALDPHTGDSRWRTSLGPCLDAGPAMMAGQPGVVEVTSCGRGTAVTDHATLVDPSGHLRWQREATGPLTGQARNNLVLGMGPGMVAVQFFAGPRVVYSPTGEVVEQCACTTDSILQPTQDTAPGLVLDAGFLGDAQHVSVIAYDANTGRQRWVSTLAGTPYDEQEEDLIASGPRVFLSMSSVTLPLLELDPATGAVRATYAVTRPPTDTYSQSVAVSAIDGGAYLVYQGFYDPHGLTAYAS